jgi:diguanylate cyclase (GGDEF)-like protein/PAS domain S-box-containing protein
MASQLDSKSPDMTTVLLVEDNPADQRLIKEFLREISHPEYQVHAVDRLDVARAMLTDSPDEFDAILLDQNLTDGIGVDLIREMARNVVAPMVLLTGFDSREIDMAAMAAGASAFLSKQDVNAVTLDRTIRHAIDRQRSAVELREKCGELEETNVRLKKTTAQLEAESANIIKLAEHLAKAPDSSEISYLTLDNDSETSYRTVARASRIGVWHIVPSGTTIEINAPMREMLGLQETEVFDEQSFWHLFGSPDRAAAKQALKVWSNGTTSSFEASAVLRGSDAGSRMILSGCPLRTDDGKIGSIMVTAVDVTDRRQAEALVKDLAQRDPLTGLLNRSMYSEMLASAMQNNDRNATRLALFYIDLDGFKRVNDTLGHHAGDELLKRVSERLLDVTRDSDFAARLGGDEFTVVLNNLHTPAGAAKVAQSVLEVMHAPCVVEGKTIAIKPSIGIAIFPDDSRDPEQLKKDADLALYRAKESGGDMYQFFDTAMRKEDESRRACKVDLARAIDDDSFKIAYQPQIDLDSMVIAGVEALIRWDRPGHGMCFPDSFLSIAEETGLIIPIGDWVLKRACEEIVSRPLLINGNTRLGVNLSARQLKQPELPSRIRHILKETGFAANMLELEITETAVIDDIDASALIINSLRDLGVRISLDDFGTGYSSLSVLKRLSVDSLKIDRSFVNRICENATDAAIAESTINLGARLGFRVVAEGVETPDQLELLREMGCHEAQGYFFSRPLFTDVLDDWLADYNDDLQVAS